MRVTNSMISNRSQVHISNAKNKMLTAEEQYTTMKKIQPFRGSDDRIPFAEISHNNGTVDTIC